jgi:hypothetical protein
MRIDLKALRGMLLVGMLLVAGCAQQEDYFPEPASEGGWRTDTSPEFVRSLEIDPAKLSAFGEPGVQEYLSGPS